MTMSRFANIKELLFVLLFVFFDEQNRNSFMNSQGVFNLFDNLIGGCSHVWNYRCFFC